MSSKNVENNSKYMPCGKYSIFDRGPCVTNVMQIWAHWKIGNVYDIIEHHLERLTKMKVVLNHPGQPYTCTNVYNISRSGPILKKLAFSCNTSFMYSFIYAILKTVEF